MNQHPIDFAKFKFIDATSDHQQSDRDSCKMVTSIIIIFLVIVILSSVIGGCAYKRRTADMYVSGMKAEVEEEVKDVHLPSVTFDKDCQNLTACKENDTTCSDIKTVSDELKIANAHKIVQKVEEHNRTMIMIYAPWCPHCHRAMPNFVEASKVNPDIQYMVINAELVPRTLLTESFKVSHFPFIIKKQVGKSDAVFKANPTKEALLAFEDEEVAPLPPTEKKIVSTEDLALNEVF